MVDLIELWLRYVAQAVERTQSLTTVIGGIMSAVACWHAWRGRAEALARAATAAELVTIRLFAPTGNALDLPYRIRRADCTRPEVMGILGMYSGGKRYDLFGVRSAIESGDIEAVRSGRLDPVIFIHCTQPEFDGFYSFVYPTLPSC